MVPIKHDPAIWREIRSRSATFSSTCVADVHAKTPVPPIPRPARPVTSTQTIFRVLKRRRTPKPQSPRPKQFSGSCTERRSRSDQHRFIDPSRAPPGFHGLRPNSSGVSKGRCFVTPAREGGVSIHPSRRIAGTPYVLLLSCGRDRGRWVRQRQWRRLKERPRRERKLWRVLGDFLVEQQRTSSRLTSNLREPRVPTPDNRHQQTCCKASESQASTQSEPRRFFTNESLGAIFNVIRASPKHAKPAAPPIQDASCKGRRVTQVLLVAYPKL